jgi:peptide/nickel transport system permease protein
MFGFVRVMGRGVLQYVLVALAATFIISTLISIGAEDVSYLSWLGGVSHLDFGRTSSLGGDVPIAVWKRLPVSLFLVVWSLFFTLVASVVISYLLFRYRYSRLLRAVSMLLDISSNMPVFLLSILALLAMFSVFGSDYSSNVLVKLIVGGIVLAFGDGCLSTMVREFKITFERLAGKRYIVACRIRKIGYFATFARSFLLSFVTIAANRVVYLLSGIVIVEFIFMVPGLGSATIDALLSGGRTRDHDLLLGITLLFVTVVYLFRVVDSLVSAHYTKGKDYTF